MLNKNILGLITISGICLGLSGCSTTTTIYPQANNQYQAVTLSDDQGDAQEDAMKQATKTCAKENKQVVVNNTSTIYQGVGQEQTAAAGAASMAVGVATGVFVGNPLQKDNDYKTILNFTCQ